VAVAFPHAGFHSLFFFINMRGIHSRDQHCAASPPALTRFVAAVAQRLLVCRSVHILRLSHFVGLSHLPAKIAHTRAGFTRACARRAQAPVTENVQKTKPGIASAPPDERAGIASAPPDERALAGILDLLRRVCRCRLQVAAHRSRHAPESAPALRKPQGPRLNYSQ